ncbi:hypothetical protein ACWCQQ_38500 [Streptomyces sp. NPDC002143]
MHLLMTLTMAALGIVTALAAVAEARHGAPAPHWVTHLIMGAVMSGMHVSHQYLLWSCGAVLAAAAVWTGLRHGSSAILQADCADLASCAVLVCASAGRQGIDLASMPWDAHAIGHHSGSGTALHAAASLIALITALTWSAARSVIHVHTARGVIHRPAVDAVRTQRRSALVVRTTGLGMVPLMTVTVIWG